MRFHIISSIQELLYAYADYFIEQANNYITATGRFNVALSGGSSPKKVYEILASEPFRNRVDWSKVHFFFGDERHVPANDERNNALMVSKALFEPLNILPGNIFKINTALPPVESAEDYMDRITSYFDGKPIIFDLVLLGLGDNAHTASLFPNTPVIHEKLVTVKEVFLKESNEFRITLSAPMINQAKHIAFLVFGENKAEALNQVINGEPDPEKYPAQLIQPKNNEVHWFLDESVAELL